MPKNVHVLVTADSAWREGGSEPRDDGEDDDGGEGEGGGEEEEEEEEEEKWTIVVMKVVRVRGVVRVMRRN